MDMALALPVFKIDKDYIAKLDELPSAADKAALLEAILTAELTEDNPHFTYRQLGERLTLIKAKWDASDKIAEQRLKAFQDIAKDKAKYDSEPDRLGLNRPGEYLLFTVLREFSTNKDEVYLSDCARRMVAHLLGNKLMLPGWSHSRGGRMRVEQSLLAESWNPDYAGLGFNPDDANPPFLQPAVNELVNADATS